MIAQANISNLDTELWILYGIATAVLLLRFAVRLKVAGIRSLQGDDYLSILVFLSWNVNVYLIGTIHHLFKGIDLNVPPGELEPESVAKLIEITKINIAFWYTYATSLWLLKGTVLFFFGRLTSGLWEQKLVKWMAVACALSFVVVILTISLSCLPFDLHWQTRPPPPDKCFRSSQDVLVASILNIITDLGIIVIPIPLLIKLMMSIYKKIMVSFLLLTGIVCIVAAIVRLILCFAYHQSPTILNAWAIREMFIGILAINLASLRPLFARTFWTGEKPISSAHSSAKPLRTYFKAGPIIRETSLPGLNSGDQNTSRNTHFSEADDIEIGALPNFGGEQGERWDFDWTNINKTLILSGPKNY